MNKEFPYLLNIGFNNFIPCQSIIGIFSADIFEETMDKSNFIIYSPSDNNRIVKSYIYCNEDIWVEAYIETSTLKKRYDKFKDRINGILEN